MAAPGADSAARREVSASRSALAAIVPTTPVRRQSAGCAYNSIEKPPQKLSTDHPCAGSVAVERVRVKARIERTVFQFENRFEATRRYAQFSRIRPVLMRFLV